MSRLAEKYNIPTEAVSKLVKDGVISCSWPMREELFELYKKMKGDDPTKSQTEICYEIAAVKKVAPNTVRDAIQRLK